MLQIRSDTPASFAGVTRKSDGHGRSRHEVQRHGRRVILDLLAEPVGQPRELRINIRIDRF
jgi:hypothetical protein